MTKQEKIYVAGHRGMVGSAIVRTLQQHGQTHFVTRTHAELDLTNQAAVQAFFEKEKPTQVYLAAAIALSTDTTAITCISNDYSFDEVFARQVQGLGRAGDVLLAISTSGNSRNVIRAVEEARAAGMSVIGLLGREGGALNELCDVAIVVPSQVTARIQESHILIGHTLCGMIEQQLGLV